MTLLLVAVLTCNGCNDQLILHGFIPTRNVALSARGKGWRHGETDLCPACIAGAETQPQLPLEAVS